MKGWKWWILVSALAAAAWWLRDALVVLFALLLLSATLAYAASPLARFFEDRVSRKWGALLAFLGLVALIAAWLISFLPMLIRQAIAVGEALPALWERGAALLEDMQGRLYALGIPQDIMLSLSEQIGHVGASLMEGLRDRVMGLAQKVMSLGWVAFSPVVAYYLLRDRKRVFSRIERWIPSHIRPLIAAIASASREAIGHYVRGQVIVSIITGILTAAGLLIAGLPSWLLMGSLMMIFNLIPYFGPVLGAVPILVLATAGGWGMIVKCLVVILAAQQIEAMFIAPRILSSTADLHPVIVVIALFIGGFAGGLAGMVFVIPCVLILRVVMESLIDHRLRTLAREE